MTTSHNNDIFVWFLQFRVPKEARSTVKDTGPPTQIFEFSMKPLEKITGDRIRMKFDIGNSGIHLRMGGIDMKVPLLPILGISELFVSIYRTNSFDESEFELIKEKKPTWCKSIPIFFDPNKLPNLQFEQKESIWFEKRNDFLSPNGEWKSPQHESEAMQKVANVIQKEGLGVYDTDFKPFVTRSDFNPIMTPQESTIEDSNIKEFRQEKSLITEYYANRKDMKSDSFVVFGMNRLFRDQQKKMPMTVQKSRFYAITTILFEIPTNVLDH